MDWSNKWQMPFNTSKCSTCNQKFDYFMDNVKLETVMKERDLGVCISETLKPSMQCQQAYSKASKALGLIGRTISYKSKDVFSDLGSPSSRIPCLSLVTTKDKLLLERVQHRFTRMVSGLKHMSYDNRLHIGIWSLRRETKSCRSIGSIQIV